MRTVNYRSLMDQIRELADLIEAGADPQTILAKRVDILETVLFYLLGQSRAEIKDETSHLGKHDKELALLRDALQSEIILAASIEDTDEASEG